MPTPHLVPSRPRLRTALLLVALTSASLGHSHAQPFAADPDNGGLSLPDGFQAIIAADNLIDGRKVRGQSDQLRFIAVAPDGVVYAKTLQGGIIALRDTNRDGRLDQKQEFGSGGGTGIAVQGNWLYHSSTSAVFRYPRRPGEFVPAGQPQTIVADLPDHGSHTAKSFAFDGDGRLVVEVGSPYNVFSEPDRQRGAKGRDASEHQKTHGGLWRFDPDKTGQRQADGFHYSTGHRHMLAFAWQPMAKTFFGVMMGRDNMDVVAPDHCDALDNAERVAEEMHRLDPGTNLGWPYTYWDPIKKARMVSPEFGGDNRRRAEAGKYPDPVVAFPAHWAPLQMIVYIGTQCPKRYRGGAFMAFRGSWNRALLPQAGFNISFAPFDAAGNPRGNYEVFASGNGRERFRMGGVAQAPDGSLYISETERGRIWRISHSGAEGTPVAEGPVRAAPPAAAPAKAAEPAGDPSVPTAGDALMARGRRVYEMYCGACHMPDGAGAGQLQPSLVQNSVVGGDPVQLIDVILRGPAEVLPKDRPRYGNVMPPFPFLSDVQVAELVSYLRQSFGNNAPAVLPENVASARARLPAP